MSATVSLEMFTFDELNDGAKEKARAWYRGLIDSDEISDCVFDDAVEIARIIGIEIGNRPVRLMNGKTRYEPSISWSEFGSQGDGASFSGSYAYAKESVRKIKEYAPVDTKLHSIAERLAAVQRRNFYRITANISQHSRYCHEYGASIDVDYCRNSDADEIIEAMRDFMRWIFSQLEMQNDYLNSDENVDECILANGYTFDEDGDRV